MNLCSDDHEEVCYEGRRCPVCEAVSDKNREIERLEMENDNLQDQVKDLESQLESQS